MFFQVVEVDEESAELFGWDAAAEVLDAELELNVARVPTHFVVQVFVNQVVQLQFFKLVLFY